MPDLSGRLAVVTGANGGLGLEVARELSRRGAHVAMAHVAGARTLALLRAATDPNAVCGALYTPRWVNWGPPVRRPLLGRSRSRKAMTTLWEVSERETGIAFDVPRRRIT
jgi:NAD(P)-dependent dehydrogenase (short-subunit alcohol dehydrogenase family)